MFALLLPLLPMARPLLPWLLAGALAVGAVAWVYHRGSADQGAAAAKAGLRQEIEQRRTRDEAERAVAAEPDPAASLRSEWERP